jgi:hypothetical protein
MRRLVHVGDAGRDRPAVSAAERDDLERLTERQQPADEA